VSQTAGPVDKRRRPRGLTRAVRTAIDAMMFDRCTRAEACVKAGITERALYLALAKPEVARHWNTQLDVLRSGERARNFHRLTELRDQDVHKMAAVNAVKELETAAASIPPGGSAGAVQPGLVIVIVPNDAEREEIRPPKTIDHKPGVG
jgi:hypothetical protein